MSGMTRYDRITIDNILEKVGLAPIVEKTVEARLSLVWTYREKACRFCSQKSRSNSE